MHELSCLALPPRTCSSLFNGPVCCPQCPILNFWAVVALFVKHVFCCCGHHILKKSKWWGMPACALQLGWPQTSDEQSGAMRCRAWLPLLGTQWRNGHFGPIKCVQPANSLSSTKQAQMPSQSSGLTRGRFQNKNKNFLF